MTITALGAAYEAAEWVIRIGALLIVPKRRAPTAALSWLLLIFFLPIAGGALFLAIGSPRFPRWRAERFARLRDCFVQTSAEMASVAKPVMIDDESIAQLAETLGGLTVCDGNMVELIDDYELVIHRLVDDIDHARVSVEIIVYIFAGDAAGRRVVAALARAVGRGVRCRVMLDPIGSLKWRKGVTRLLRESGVDVRAALPFRFWRGRTRRDMRDHRKLFVIDGAIGYVGSQNIVGKEVRPGVVNRELVARVAGPIVAAMTAVIAIEWALEDSSPVPATAVPAKTGDAVLQLLPSGADYPLQGFETLLVWQLHRAHTHAIIVTPYFIPDEDVVGAMRTAAARGVAVDLVVSRVVDQRIVNLAQCSYYDDLLTSGVTIRLFRDYLLHAKTISIDGQFAVVGSSNVDLRSFQLNEETSLLLHDTASVAAVQAIQAGYLTNSDRIDLDTWRQRPAWRPVAENTARLISALL